MSSITFVTCFLDIYEESEIIKTSEKKSLEKRLFYFKELASTGIQICLYISSNMENSIIPITNQYKNIKYKIVNINDLNTWKIVNEHNVTMPYNRCMIKDTFEYLIIMNSKIEFIEYTIKDNPWNSSHFAWIDFNIFYVFKNFNYCKKWLQFLSSLKLKDNFLTIPGCFSYSSPFHKENENLDNLLNNIYWRFCGGFFIGDKNSLLEFYQLYDLHFPLFLKIYGKLTWEVNFWSWLESFTDWKPIWYSADHNDSILQLSSDFYSENMSKHVSILKKYDYPSIKNYNPSSACYIEYQGHKILNTRFVNYTILENGSYNVHSPDKNTLSTLNYLSILDSDFHPINYIQMEENVKLTDYLNRAKNFVSKGFEDLRLYISNNNQLKFIATTIQYSPLGQNRMVFGNYDIETKKICDLYLIEPPNPKTWCEKNWIPIRHPNIKEDCFIYSWNPFQVGKVIEGNTTQSEFSHKLVIFLTREYNNFPLLNKLRGSSCFVPYDEDTLVGVVHYSEEYHPRHYYHLLVQLDSKSLSVKSMSQPFIFQKNSIEFCIGFHVNKIDTCTDFCFWISQIDRDPLFITLPSHCFHWTKIR
jgi:hypothetical protein